MPLPVAAFTEQASCRLCPELRPALRAIRSAFVLDGPPRELVHSLKYKGWYSIAESMGTRMAAVDWPGDVRGDISVVVPVPLSRTRARQRGYNQAALLAREVARRNGWICSEDVLERGRFVGSQTTLHPGERRANVAGAFRVRTERATSISMQHILVVDDVWTTGATALACGDALLSAGARAFSVLTFARALPELERQQRRAELAGISPS